MKQQVHKCSKKQKRTARAAMSCLMLLLLYGCTYQEHTDPAVSLISEEADIQSEKHAQEEMDEPDKIAAQEGTALPETGQMIAVFVCGAVKHSGVYELPIGSRVYEALALAGGLTDEASSTAVNQAELLSDGQMIQIPTVEEEQAKVAQEKAKTDGLVNINTADLETLKTLPGIGDSKARSIIAYREKNGAFKAIEDIKNIEGIKDGVFAKLEGCIKVD